MKLGKNNKGASGSDLASINSNNSISKPRVNQAKKSSLVIIVTIITIVLIAWVALLGSKAERTVEVVMMSQNVYKNQVITKEMIEPYKMLEAEFEKYSIVDENGVKKRRVVLWEEAGKLIGTFAAYPLKMQSYGEYRDFIKSKTDNSDNVMYSFPGKIIVPLELGGNELSTFKTFLAPGDRIMVQAIYTSEEQIGEGSNDVIETIRTDTLFKDIVLADLLNSNGDSILDIYAGFNEKTVWQQSQLEGTETFKASVEPSSMLIAFTPDEFDLYYRYTAKKDVQFRVALPQRLN